MRHFSVSGFPNVRRKFFLQCPLDYDRKKTSAKRSFFLGFFCVCLGFFLPPFLSPSSNPASLFCNLSKLSHPWKHYYGNRRSSEKRQNYFILNFIFLSATYIFTIIFLILEKLQKNERKIYHLLVVRGKKILNLPAVTFRYLLGKKKKKLKKKLTF